MLRLPGKILIGPIYNCPRMLGDWLGHPDLKVFVTDPAQARTGYDLVYHEQTDTFQDLISRLPAGWQPDWIIWWDLVFQGLPAGIEDSPWPLVAMAGDWNLGWQTIEQYAEVFDLLITDRPLHQLLQARGIRHSVYSPCYSFLPDLHQPLPETEYLYDLTFIGNLNFYVHHRRSQYLQRLALLAERYRVCIANGIFGRAYARLLAQSRIVVNHSVRGEMNMRAYEAPACGALLMMEADNAEVADFLSDGESCVLYTAENFEARIDWYLTHEHERQRVARAGYQQIQAYRYTRQLEKLFQYLPALTRKKSVPLSSEKQILRRWKQWHGSGSLSHWGNMIGELQHTTAAETPCMLNACVALWLDASFRFLASEQPEQAETCRSYARVWLERLAQHVSADWLLDYLWGWFQCSAGEWGPALAHFERADQLLLTLSGQELQVFSDFMLPFGLFQHFQVEWERILSRQLEPQRRAEACQQLLHWQMLVQQGELLTELGHPERALVCWRQALQVRPDLGLVAYRIGCLLRAEQPEQALQAFREAATQGVLLAELWQAHAWLAFEQQLWSEACAVALQGSVLLQANQKVPEIQRELTALSALAQAFQQLKTGSLSTVLACLTGEYHPLWLRILPELKVYLAEESALALPWALQWVSAEPPAPLPPDSGAVWSTASGVLTLGRLWDPAEIRFSPEEWPYHFLSPAERAPVVLEDRGALNLLVLIPDWDCADLNLWLAACVSLFVQVPELHFFLCTTSDCGPAPTHLIEHWPCPEAMPWTLLGEEVLSLAEIGGVMSQMQAVLAAPTGWQDYLLHWALAMEIPVAVMGNSRVRTEWCALSVKPEALWTWWRTQRADSEVWSERSRCLKSHQNPTLLAAHIWHLRCNQLERFCS